MSTQKLKDFALSVVNEAMRGIIAGDNPAFVHADGSPSLSSSSQGQKQSLNSGGYKITIGGSNKRLFEPEVRSIVSMAPEGTVLIRKREFSSLKESNEVQWMDATEKMLLRSTKALFAGKVEQIRLYESLTKFENFFSTYQEYSLNLLSQVMSDLEAIAEQRAESANHAGGFFSDLVSAVFSFPGAARLEQTHSELIDLIRRNAFAQDNLTTTWVVDPSNIDNYGIGPGTGTIELNMFSSFATNCDLKSAPSSASIDIEDPYRIMYISDEDIEMAIEEAMDGTAGIFSRLSDGMYSKYEPNKNKYVGVLRGVVDGLAKANINVGHIRERMRTFYLGKPIINPADGVNFYIRGNRTFEDYSKIDNKKIPVSSIDTSYLEVDENILKAEKELYTKGGLSFDAYKKIRVESDASFGKVHVFGGLVTTTSEDYSGGSWGLKVSCSDNMEWLRWSRFCKQPALANKKGILEDPLTPFEYKRNEDGSINYNERQDLLSENKKLLASGLLSYDNGILSGQNASEENLMQGQFTGDGSLFGTRVIQHPNGFVYRWKTGILTATAGFQATDPTGEGVRQEKINQEHYGLTIAEQIFTNLDIANILSILVVGEPYNVSTFVENSLQAHTITKKSITGLNAQDPIAGVLDAIRNQNNFYGNFRPYRMITMNQESIQKSLQSQQIRIETNSIIEKLQNKRRSINKRIAELKKSKQTENSILIRSLETESKSVEAAIKKQVEIGMDAIVTDEGSKVSLSLNLFGDIGISGGGMSSDQAFNKAIMLVGAQRRIEDVKLNRDRNLFIVSDQYDTTDLKPFLLNLNKSGWKLFDAGYTSAMDQMTAAVQNLNMEFFCNTNGHLEFRPPQWNKVPYTVLEDAIASGKQKGTPVVPGFITSMFQSRIDDLYIEIHTLNIKIALIALLMGRYPDRFLIPNIPPLNTGEDSLDFFGIDVDKKVLSLENTSATFTPFGSLDSDGNLTGNGLSLRASSRENDGDVLFGNTNIILGDLDFIFQEANGIMINFDDGKPAFGKRPARQAGHSTVQNLNNIRDSFMAQFGRDPAAGLGIDKSEGFKAKDFSFIESDKQGISIDNNGLLKKLKQAISQRDKSVRILQSNLAKKEELSKIEEIFTRDTDIERTGPLAGAIGALEKVAEGLGSAIDAIKGDSLGGSIYDHLIDDNRRNLLGPGSGARFIIEDHNITQMSFTESPPQYTRIDVTGNAPLGLAQKLNNATDSLYFWAGAADFDLWRQYGYKAQVENVPFISDSESQARPYAILKLQLAKANINRGSVTVVGNEYYQPGDTVYIPSKGLLYYVESVNHNFSQGNSFTTGLGLTYGHPPGSYLPSPLDVIGQQVSKNIMEQSIMTYRSSTGDDSYRPLSPDCTLIMPESGASMEDVLSNSDNEVRFTNMMIDIMGTMMSNSYLLIRAFVKDSKDSGAISAAEENIDRVRKLFENPGRIRLPNNIPVTPVSKSRIMEQVVYLDRREEAGAIGTLRCFDRRQTGLFKDGSSTISKKDAAGILPIGGPSQKGWLDLQVVFGNDREIIEVGILNIKKNFR